ncbi:hypothetical protein ABZ890_47460 [Streptomyces sp. NPDC046984]|uniref:hypothetical protein n=1 Tax=Streptomyces sp. NPDC046984 TaxID=3155138 RepID=UPI0033F2F128
MRYLVISKNDSARSYQVSHNRVFVLVASGNAHEGVAVNIDGQQTIEKMATGREVESAES